MAGKSLELQCWTLGQGNSSARRVIRPRKVGARFEAEVGRDNSIPCPIPIAGLFKKRIMDLLLSAIALLLLWPLMLVIALIVKLESPGPVIYPSLRGGKGDKHLFVINSGAWSMELTG